LAGHSAQAALFGIRIDRIDMVEAVERVLGWCLDAPSDGCRVIVTPNVDHLVILRRSAALRSVYAGADLVVADGVPLVVASRWLGQALPGRVAGSDLVPALFDGAVAGGRALRVFLLGAAPGVAETAAANVTERWPAVSVVGTCSPPWGFENDPAESTAIVDQISEAAPDLLLVGLGAPKQELWVHSQRSALAPHVQVAMCVGATIDFLAGSKRRAPEWMRSSGLEWLYRLSEDPRRLARRYAHDAVVFPQLLWQERALLRAARSGGLGPVSAVVAPVIDLRDPAPAALATEAAAPAAAGSAAVHDARPVAAPVGTPQRNAG
jgi:N-acetylglucosaminyldiphosphoundecaprenol N-acetyl-beta-D-mannosaminyltransferase